MRHKMHLLPFAVGVSVLACELDRAQIDVADDDLSIELNDPDERRPIDVLVFTAGGAPLAPSNWLWISSEPEVADVNSEGIVTPGRDGRSEITVFADRAWRTIAVRVAVYERLELSEDRVTMIAGEARVLGAQIRGRDGRVIDGELAWSSADSDVVEVDSAGMLTAVAPGSTAVLVRAGRLSAQAEINVVLPGPETAFPEMTPAHARLAR